MQTCVTANRIFVHESIHDEFVSRLAVAMDDDLKVGSGLEPGVNQGPLINQRQLDRVSPYYNPCVFRMSDTIM